MRAFTVGLQSAHGCARRIGTPLAGRPGGPAVQDCLDMVRCVHLHNIVFLPFLLRSQPPYCSQPWSEDYTWTMPVGTQQMEGLRLEMFRAGLRHKKPSAESNAAKILMCE